MAHYSTAQAHPEEPNWGIARAFRRVFYDDFLNPSNSDRLLMPCFNTASVYNMFDGMMDIMSQLVLKWER